VRGKLARLRYLALTSTAFVVAVGINTASVAIEQRRGLLTRCFGSKGWYVHLAVISPGWAWFFLLLRKLGTRTIWPLPKGLRPFGGTLLPMAAAGWLLAFIQLGPVRTLNGNNFGRANADPITVGSFHWSPNPMYDSYVIAFIGRALRDGNGVYLLLAAQSFILLNLIEASVEGRSLVTSNRIRAGALD